MKQLYIKLILTVTVLLAGYLTLTLIFDRNPFIESGHLDLIIEDSSGHIHFDQTLYYEANTTFFEILDEEFDLTCATSFYEPDTSCAYTFNIMGIENHVLLGIKSNDFNLLTDWDNTFFKLQVFDGEKYIDSVTGFDQLDLSTYSKIKIVVEEVR